MEFGKVENVDQIQFELPPDDERNTKFISQDTYFARGSFLDFRIGAPVWGVKGWLGSVYPAGAAPSSFLYFYSRQFNTIEMNLTHYKIPDDATIARWIDETPSTFRFAPKFPQDISHSPYLVGSRPGAVDHFCEQMLKLGPRLGTCFLQLPPYFGINKLSTLKTFLRDLPRELRLAVEFRNTDWFIANHLLEPAVEALAEHNAGTVITDVAGRRDVLHSTLTNSTAMIRFIGNDLHPTDYSRLEDWISRIHEWIDHGVSTIYFFVHQPGDKTAPPLINHFIERVNTEFHVALEKWTPQEPIRPESNQMSFFD